MRKKKPKIEPKAGIKIGKLLVLSFCRIKASGKEVKGVVCRCDCGETVKANYYSVKYQLKTSCGCSYGIHIVGERFGKLLAVKQLDADNRGLRMVECICDCGNKKIVSASELKGGGYKSCGCNQFPVKTKQYRDHPLYDVWKGMKARCRDKKNISYQRYGGTGVKVCEEWQRNFISFYNWCMANGWEHGLEIDKDKIPKKLGIPAKLYSPEMCSILTRKENVRLSSHTKLNEADAFDIIESTTSTSELSKKYKVTASTIHRIKNKELWQ